MGTAALTARLPLVRGRRHAAEATACGLRFDRPGGPVVAVCGLTGGAGASTLAFALARQAARESSVPVLLTEAASAGGDLATLAGCCSPLSLGELGERVARGEQPERVFCEPEPGLRLIASAPRRALDVEEGAVARVLDDARSAHGLVVIDCGQVWRFGAAILERATHVVWALPATRAALRRAQLLLATDALPRAGGARELLAAIFSQPGRRASVRELRRLARIRCDHLLLIPHLPELSAGRPDDTGALAGTLTALATALRPA